MLWWRRFCIFSPPPSSTSSLIGHRAEEAELLVRRGYSIGQCRRLSAPKHAAIGCGAFWSREEGGAKEGAVSVEAGPRCRPRELLRPEGRGAAGREGLGQWRRELGGNQRCLPWGGRGAAEGRERPWIAARDSQTVPALGPPWGGVGQTPGLPQFLQRRPRSFMGSGVRVRTGNWWRLNSAGRTMFLCWYNLRALGAAARRRGWMFCAVLC